MFSLDQECWPTIPQPAEDNKTMRIFDVRLLNSWLYWLIAHQPVAECLTHTQGGM